MNRRRLDRPTKGEDPDQGDENDRRQRQQDRRPNGRAEARDLLDGLRQDGRRRDGPAVKGPARDPRVTRRPKDQRRQQGQAAEVGHRRRPDGRVSEAVVELEQSDDANTQEHQAAGEVKEEAATTMAQQGISAHDELLKDERAHRITGGQGQSQDQDRLHEAQAVGASALSGQAMISLSSRDFCSSNSSFEMCPASLSRPRRSRVAKAFSCGLLESSSRRMDSTTDLPSLTK